MKRGFFPSRVTVRNAGVALVTVLVLLLLVAPLAMVTYKMASSAMFGAVPDKHRRTAIEYANNAIMDYMRQFSNDYYANHFSSATLARPEYSFASGFMKFVTTPTSDQRTILLRAIGKFGLDPDHPRATQEIYGLIFFQSDLTRFGTSVSLSPLTGNNATYTGPFVMQNGSVAGTNVVFERGPLVVQNDIYFLQPTTVNADIYIGGNQGGNPANLTLNGLRYPFAPKIPRPTLSTTYYNAYCTWKSTVTTSLYFLGNGTFMTSQDLNYYINNNTPYISSATYSWSSPEVIPPIESGGGVFYCENCNLGVSGSIGARVTVVASGAAGSSNNGNIVITGDLVYGTGSDYAGIESSLALLATNHIKGKKIAAGTTADLTFRLHGVFYQENKDSLCLFVGQSTTSSKTLVYYGARHNLFGTNEYDTYQLFYDPNLRKYPPPALPERPFLVNWNMRKER